MHLVQSFKKLFQAKAFVFIAFIVFPFLHFDSHAYAIQIPPDLATVQEKSDGTRPKTFVLIQEAHVDYNAQKAIIEILKKLIQEDSLRLILVEGGWGDVSLSYLRNYGSPEGRTKVAEQFLREGKISAEEYLDLTSDFSISLWGLEDPQLYEDNMKAFFAANEKAKRDLEGLGQLKTLTDRLGEKIFSPGLREFLKKKDAFDHQKISLIDYLHFLSPIPEAQKSFERFPVLRRIHDLSAGGKDFDVEKVDWEKQEILRALSRRLTKPELERLQIGKSRKNPEDEIRFLRTLMEMLKRYPALQKKVRFENLARYTKVLGEIVHADSGQIFDPLKGLEQASASAMARTDDERKLLEGIRLLGLLEKLFELKLVSSEHEELRNLLVATPDFSRFKKFLSEKSEPFQISSGMPDFELIARDVPLAMAFYDTALRREKALIDHAVEKMESEDAAAAAVILGGFHAKRMAESLKAKGYSVLSLIPRFVLTDASHSQENYFEILKYKWNFHEKRDSADKMVSPPQGGKPQYAVQS